MITHSDEDPDRHPDDPLTVLLSPPADYLGAPPGRYEAIRRGAARRRLLHAAAGAVLTAGVAALVAVPFWPSGADTPRSPTVPMAPPAATSSAPERSASPAPSPVPTERPAAGLPSERGRATRSTPSDPSLASRTSVPTVEPSAVPTGR